MIETTAQMICHQKYDLRGNPEQVTVEWQGPKSGTLAISERFIGEAGTSVIRTSRDYPKIGDVIFIGPYKLRVFEHEPPKRIYYLVRIDSFVGNLRAATYRLTRWLDLIYRRLIITAAVWRLGDYDPSKVPAWDDIHILKRFKK